MGVWVQSAEAMQLGACEKVKAHRIQQEQERAALAVREGSLEECAVQLQEAKALLQVCGGYECVWGWGFLRGVGACGGRGVGGGGFCGCLGQIRRRSVGANVRGCKSPAAAAAAAAGGTGCEVGLIGGVCSATAGSKGSAAGVF